MTNEISVLARLSWTRLLRSRTKWVTALLAVIPPVFAALLVTYGDDPIDEVWEVTIFWSLRMAVLIAVAVHLAPAVGEELEQKTFTYLWSRPMKRSAMIYGKLLATAPPIAGVFLVSFSIAWIIVFGADAGEHVEELVRALAAVVAVVASGSALALAAGAIVPRYPLAVVLAYIIIGERLLEFVPLLQQTSIAFHASSISGAHPAKLLVGTPLSGAVGLAVLTFAWMALAIWRVERAEYALPDG